MLTDAEMTPALDTPSLNVLPLTTWMPATMLVGLADTRVTDWVSLPVELLVMPPAKLLTLSTLTAALPPVIRPVLVMPPRKVEVFRTFNPTPDDDEIVPALLMPPANSETPSTCTAV